jgi:lipoyl(octanoyl) transferase|tara:strand:- start:3209 stop:3868 length:660 start_codon:yes stop_codon:yes gene_type:complete
LKNNVEWKISNSLIKYDLAISEMENRVLNIKNNSIKELVWLLEHKSIYTAGSSAKDKDLLNKSNIEIRYTGRGGQWTWHGPGQRVVYIILNLKQRLPDVKAYVNALEELIILSLNDFSVQGVRLLNKPGVWVKNKHKKYDKIAALGVRISSWISWHGISINVNPDLNNYNNIIPCGNLDGGVTSLHSLNKEISMEQLDNSLKKNFLIVFGDNSLFKLKL